MVDIRSYYFISLLILLLACSCNPLQEQQVRGLNPRGGCPSFFQKLENQEPVTIVYFGGSITNHRGYRVYSEAWFREQYPASDITTVNAGIGGTGSDLGVFRMDEDVIAHDPDLVFVEFAVNDAENDSVNICRSMEGIVRKLLRDCPGSEICFLYSVSELMLDDLLKGKLFSSMRLMERVAEHYEIPSINFAMDVLDLMEKDSLIFRGEKGRDYSPRKMFSNDGVHPSFEVGHKLYTSTLTRSMIDMADLNNQYHRSESVPPLYPENFEKAREIPISEFVRSQGWKVVSATDYIYDNYLGSSRVFPGLLCSSDPEDFIEVRFSGRVAGLFDVIGPSSAGYTAEIDGTEIIHQQRFDKYCGSFFRSNYSLLPEMKDTVHTLIFRPNTTHIDKPGMINIELSKVKDPRLFDVYNTYVGSVLIVGDLN